MATANTEAAKLETEEEFEALASMIAKMLKGMSKLYEPLRSNPGGGMPLGRYHGQWLPIWLPLLWPQIQKFEFHESDIAICSFPKSGTHWLQYIVYLIDTGDFVTVPKDNRRRVFLEIPEPPVPFALEMAASREPPRHFSSHLRADLLPPNIFKGRVIYVYRNPKDIAVSLYYHNLALNSDCWPYDPDFDNHAKRFMDGEVFMGPYPDHVKSYVDLQKQGKPILILRYEDIKKNPKAAIRQVATFMGKELSDDMVEKIAVTSSFDKMRDTVGVNWEIGKKVGIWHKDHDFIRKGIVGDWKNHFKNPELLAQFEEWIKTSVPSELVIPTD